jgi:hypothetical protein
MVNKCMYCSAGLSAESVLDVCNSCGPKVWGDKMFKAIIANMENAREVGDLYQGSVSNPSVSEDKSEII